MLHRNCGCFDDGDGDPPLLEFVSWLVDWWTPVSGLNSDFLPTTQFTPVHGGY